MHYSKSIAGLTALVLALQVATSAAQGVLLPTAAPAPTMKSLDQLQPRTPLAAAGAIGAPGSYYLTQNITVGAGSAITISASSVALDLNGFTISSTAAPAAGTAILLSGAVSNIWIRNGFIYGAITNSGNTYSGVGFANGINYSGGTAPVNAHVSDLVVSGCLSNGIYLNSNVGYHTGNTVEACLVNDCGSYGIIADQVSDCVASAGNGAAIFALNSVNCRGTGNTGAGLMSAQSADDCVGQSTGLYGLSAGNAVNCFGKSSTYIGLNLSGIADSCYGETASGAEAIICNVGNNSYGNHTSPGGTGLLASALLVGSVGISTGTGSTGIYANSGLINGCLGLGATAAAFAYKYNMP